MSALQSDDLGPFLIFKKEGDRQRERERETSDLLLLGRSERRTLRVCQPGFLQDWEGLRLSVNPHELFIRTHNAGKLFYIVGKDSS